MKFEEKDFPFKAKRSEIAIKENIKIPKDSKALHYSQKNKEAIVLEYRTKSGRSNRTTLHESFIHKTSPLDKFFPFGIRKTQILKEHQSKPVKQVYDLVIEGKLKGQNGFGLRYEKYKIGSFVYIDFFKGDSLCLYYKDLKLLINYLQAKERSMQPKQGYEGK